MLKCEGFDVIAVIFVFFFCFCHQARATKTSRSALEARDSWLNQTDLLPLDVGQHAFDLSAPAAKQINIVWTPNVEFLAGTFTSLASILKTAPKNGKFFFRFFVLAEEDAAQTFCELWNAKLVDREDLPRCHTLNYHLMDQPDNCAPPLQSPLQTEVTAIGYRPSEEQVNTLAVLSQMEGTRRSLINHANLARNWLAQFLLPFGIEDVLYLDSDTIVREDLGRLWTALSGSDKAVLVAKRKARKPPQIHWKHPLLKKLGRDESHTFFNAGVLLINLPRYCQLHVGDTFYKLIKQHCKSRLWRGEVTTQQTPFVLSIPDAAIGLVPQQWNECKPSSFILHCTGSYRFHILNVSLPVARYEALFD